jgi:hypothetical protein
VTDRVSDAVVTLGEVVTQSHHSCAARPIRPAQSARRPSWAQQKQHMTRFRATFDALTRHFREAAEQVEQIS